VHSTQPNQAPTQRAQAAAGCACGAGSGLEAEATKEWLQRWCSTHSQAIAKANRGVGVGGWVQLRLPLHPHPHTPTHPRTSCHSVLPGSGTPDPLTSMHPGLALGLALGPLNKAEAPFKLLPSPSSLQPAEGTGGVLTHRHGYHHPTEIGQGGDREGGYQASRGNRSLRT
jgi:hypothetical protein